MIAFHESARLCCATMRTADDWVICSLEEGHSSAHRGEWATGEKFVWSSAEMEFQSAKTRLLYTIANPRRVLGSRSSFARTYSGHFIAEFGPLVVPWGWTLRRDWDRDAVTLAPLWWHWLTAFTHERWRLFRLAMRLHLWACKDGDYYVNGICPPLWCFLHDTDHIPREYRR